MEGKGLYKWAYSYEPHRGEKGSKIVDSSYEVSMKYLYDLRVPFCFNTYMVT